MVTYMLPTIMLDLRYYLTVDSKAPFEQWFNKLNSAAAAKASIALVRLEQGNVSNVKSVGDGVAEFKIDFGPGYRIYFGRDGETVVILLTGGDKSRQQRDIERAKNYWADYKRRKPSSK